MAKYHKLFTDFGDEFLEYGSMFGVNQYIKKKLLDSKFTKGVNAILTNTDLKQINNKVVTWFTML